LPGVDIDDNVRIGERPPADVEAKIAERVKLILINIFSDYPIHGALCGVHILAQEVFYLHVRKPAIPVHYLSGNIDLAYILFSFGKQMAYANRRITGRVEIHLRALPLPLSRQIKPVVTYGHVQSHAISPIFSCPSLYREGRRLATHYDDGGRALCRLYILISGI
jgi:hypothetical protein